MWLRDDVIADVDRVARIFYINVHDCKAWNATRRDDELRMLTGWVWIARQGGAYHQGFKTETVCYRDCWYALVQQTAAPIAGRPRLRVVASDKKAAAS
jgi:hypothetical protein